MVVLALLLKNLIVVVAVVVVPACTITFARFGSRPTLLTIRSIRSGSHHFVLRLRGRLRGRLIGRFKGIARSKGIGW